MTSRVGSELRRKAVHVGMGGCALLLRWLSPIEAAACTAGALLFNLFLLHRLTRRSLLREDEASRGYSLGIALYPAVVLALVVVLHPRMELAAATWALLAFGDGMATVAGVVIGGPGLPWNRGKTWSGFTAFVLFGAAASAFLVRWVQGGAQAEWIGASFRTGDPARSDAVFLVSACLAAALAAAFAESLRTGIDDNLVVPIVGGAALYGASLVEPARLLGASDVLLRNAAAGAGINAALALLAWIVGGVGRSGALSGFVLGTLLYTFSGWKGFLVLLVFFVLGTAATKIGFGKKEALGIAQDKGGRRGIGNVLANGGAGLVFAFLAAGTSHPELFLVALVAAFATAASDTVASEIGQAFGRRHFLVTTLRRVPPGTNGAISVEGTLAGAMASAIVALIARAIGILDVQGLVAVLAGAFLGSLFESYLGATLERSRVVDNEVVNFANTVAGAMAAVLIWKAI